MKIFEYTDYRIYLRDWLKHTQERQPDLTFAQIALDIGMQRPAFSKVLNGDTNFTSDQIYLLAIRLQLTVKETAFLELLVEEKRCGLAKRQEDLQNKIRVIQQEEVLASKYIQAEEQYFDSPEDRVAYYTSPWPALIHIFLTIPSYQAQPSKIRDDLGISKKEFENYLTLLHRMKLIAPISRDKSNDQRPPEKQVGEKWAATQKSVHSKDLSSLPNIQQLMFRNVSMHTLSTMPLSERYGLSVAFSVDENTFEKIRQILVKTVNSIHEIVTESTPTGVYHLSIDLFPWMKKTDD